MSNITLPEKNKVEKIRFWEDVSKNNISRSFDELKERLIPDGTTIYLFGIHVHNGRVIIKNHGIPVEAVAVWDDSDYYRTELQRVDITLIDGSKEFIRVHLRKRKVDGKASKFDFYIDSYNIWSTDLNEAYALFNKAKQGAIIKARRQIEQEYKEKLEGLSVMF